VGTWPEHLPVGALRVVWWSARYDEAVAFYRDGIGLPVLETFHDSYGLDGTILGLPGRSLGKRPHMPPLVGLVCHVPGADRDTGGPELGDLRGRRSGSGGDRGPGVRS
jgi:hypothetical protein